MEERSFWWMRTVGGPVEGDPRDGELHQVFTDDLPEHQDIEPWDERAEQPDEELETILSHGYDPAVDLANRYWRNPSEPPDTHEDGRPIWKYRYVPYGEDPSWS